MTDALETLLLAIGNAQQEADSVEHRRSQRITARKRESEAIERALGAPMVFRPRHEGNSITTFGGPKRDIRKPSNVARHVEDLNSATVEAGEAWNSRILGTNELAEGSPFPSLSRVPSASALLHALSATHGEVNNAYDLYSYSAFQQAAALAQQKRLQSESPTAPTLRNLVLFNELGSPLPSSVPTALTASTQLPISGAINFPYLFQAPHLLALGAMAGNTPGLVSPLSFSPSAFSTVHAGLPTLPHTHAPNLSAQSTLDPAFTIIGRAPKRITSALEEHLATHHAPATAPELRHSHAENCESGAEQRGSIQLPSGYPHSVPHSPHSDEDSTCTVRDTNSDGASGSDLSAGESSGESSAPGSAAVSSTGGALENSNSPALLPGCGIYSDYIHDLRTVCSQCSASGRLKSKKKPLVDSLLLLAFFSDGIKKTPNGLGYIIEDSNLARELMNIISSHIRPPSRGTNNSYDNWKRAMGKTFRKSGSYFTPKDEETARYAKHVEEHLCRIYDRKKSSSTHTD